MKIEVIKKYQRIIISSFIFIILTLFLMFLCTRISVNKNSDYSTKEEVSLYLFKYKKLPNNYITKSDVINSSIKPNNGKYIGGDVFYYSGYIIEYTEKNQLRECDIEYDDNSDLRGTKRLVYDVECEEIFYTSNHYGSVDNGSKPFEKVTRWSINITSNVFFTIFVFISCMFVGLYFFIIFSSDVNNKDKIVLKQNIVDIVKNYLIGIIFVLGLVPYLIYYLVTYVYYKFND